MRTRRQKMPMENGKIQNRKETLITTRQECTYESNMEARSRNHCCHGKGLSTTYSECVCM